MSQEIKTSPVTEVASAPSLDGVSFSSDSTIDEVRAIDTPQFGSEINQQLFEAIHEINASISSTSSQKLVEVLYNPSLTPDAKNQLVQSLHNILNKPRVDALQSTEARVELAESLIKSLADPMTIHQSDRRTCSVTASVQGRLALTNPAEYARLVEGITSESGQVKTVAGDTINFVENSELKDQPRGRSPITSRSLESRIFQSALMQFAASHERNGNLVYDPKTDNINDTSHGVITSGVYSNWQQQVTNSIFNEGSTRLDTSNVAGVQTTSNEVINAISTQLSSNGIPVAVEVNWSEQGDHSQHIMLVTEVKDGKVFFLNGWRTFDKRDGAPSHSSEITEDGKVESMSIEDFGKRLRSAYIADTSTTAAEAKLTELQANRYYDPGNSDTWHIHTEPPTSNINQSTEQQVSASESRDFQLDQEWSKAFSEAKLGDSNLVDRGAAQKANSSNRKDKDPLFDLTA